MEELSTPVCIVCQRTDQWVFSGLQSLVGGQTFEETKFCHICKCGNPAMVNMLGKKFIITETPKWFLRPDVNIKIFYPESDLIESLRPENHRCDYEGCGKIIPVLKVDDNKILQGLYFLGKSGGVIDQRANGSYFRMDLCEEHVNVKPTEKWFIFDHRDAI